MKVSHIVLGLSLLGAVGSAGAARANEGSFADEREGSVLALGDSVVFGFITQDGNAYVNPKNFIGYPEYLGAELHAHSVNAACPGETTGSFLSSGAPDNGCHLFRQGGAPLHIGYAGTQLSFATAYLKGHHDVRLVTLGLGANDGFLFLAQCAKAPNPQACISSGLPGLAQEIAQNVATILGDLRAAGYAGPIILVNYYSTDYSDPTQTGLTETLNGAIGFFASAYGATVADVFSAFKTVAAGAGGHTCRAGLLNVDPQNQAACDIHPAQSGQQLIAETVRNTFRSMR